jgi:hypothetical protein
MTKGFRITLATAALAGGLALAGVAPAQAHGRVARVSRVGVRFGDPFFRVGAIVPRGYTVIEDPAFGWGFYSGSRWIPVERYGSGWYVCERPGRGARAFVGARTGFRAFPRRSFDRDRGFAARRSDRFGRGERRSYRADRRGRDSRDGRHR